MTPILKLVLIGVILYFIYDYYRKAIRKSSFNKTKNEERDVRIFKTKEVEISKYNVDAETVDYEEIEENETK